MKKNKLSNTPISYFCVERKKTYTELQKNYANIISNWPVVNSMEK